MLKKDLWKAATMKTQIINLDYQRGESYSKRIKKLAKIKGYHGKLGVFKFLLKHIKTYILGNLAMIVPGGSLVIALQRKRGVSIGRNVFIGEWVYIDFLFPELVTIEDGVAIAPFVKILTHSKPNEAQKKWLKSFAAPVVIKKNAFVGMGAIILPGVTIGENSIIAAGSLVTKDVPSYSLVGGIPARVLKIFN